MGLLACDINLGVAVNHFMRFALDLIISLLLFNQLLGLKHSFLEVL